MANVRRLYWRIIQETGWTFPEIDAMTIGQVDELIANWQPEDVSPSPPQRAAGASVAPEATEAEFQALLAESRRMAARLNR